MGSSALTVQDELFQANVTVRFRVDDEHDPGEGKGGKGMNGGVRGSSGLKGTMGPRPSREKRLRGGRYAKVFNRREHASRRWGFPNPFVIGIVRPAVRLALDNLGCNVPVRRSTTPGASTDFNQKRRQGQVTIKGTFSQRILLLIVGFIHCQQSKLCLRYVTSERKQKRRSAAEARSSRAKESTPFSARHSKRDGRDRRTSCLPRLG